MIAAVMGWIGTVGGLSAYLLLSRGRWQASSLRYSAMNGVAGVLAGTASAVYGAWPSVASNALWTCIAAQVAFTTLRDRRAERRAERLASVVSLPVDLDPEPPTGPQPLLMAA